MIIYEYASEKHLVDEFIQYAYTNKLKLKEDLSVHLFIWGYEMWLPEGGKMGYNGAIDLIGTDELGNVWLIEAKQSANSELNPAIWNQQVLNYRKALSKRSEDEISLKSRRFLLNNGSAQVVPSYINEGIMSLYDAFCNWCVSIGKKAEANRLYKQTIENIKKERVIATVLANVFRKEILDGRPNDNHSYAYLVIRDREENCKVDVIQAIIFENDMYREELQVSMKKWSELTKEKQKVKPTKETVELYLSNKVTNYYQQCIANLEKLGWNGKLKSNQKAFVVDMPTIYGPPIRIHLGWVDFDGSFTVANRLPGEMGLKFNIDFRHFKKCTNEEIQEVGYNLAKRLAKEARYNGRGEGLNIQDRELTADEKQSWDWEMYRRINHYNRDYLGNEEEQKDFEAAWAFLNEIIDKTAKPEIRRKIDQSLDFWNAT